MRIITESELRERFRQLLATTDLSSVGYVTGPGRSGAISAVFVSHMLGVPFIPFGFMGPWQLGRALIVDTARESGKTLRKAAKQYAAASPIILVAFEEPPRVAFWYEARKPQAYRHESRVAA